MFKLRIGFNLFPYRNTRSGGMLYYALAMLREFARKIPERVTLFYGNHSRKFLGDMSGLEGVARRNIREPAEIFDYRREFDVLFTPATWGGVSMLDYPTIHVLPDIQEHYYPQFFSSHDLRNRLTFHPWVAKSSTLLITISQFSKCTMVEKLGVPEERVRVAPLAAHPIFSDESDRGLRPSNMPDVKDFLFYPSNSWKHKNHIALLDALAELRKRDGLSMPAVLSGDLLKGDYNHVDIPAEIRARGLENQVFHVGRTDLRALKFLYSNAAALCLPSLFEGFGIPLVEAMSSGCPVMAARSTSIPEVCGDSALYFDPHDHLDMAAKIRDFFDNPHEAAERRALGKERSSRFSDEKTASMHFDIMEEAYGLAGERALEKRVRSGKPARPNPLLSVLFSANGSDADANCSALTRLRSDLPDLVQLICMGPDADTRECDEGRGSGCIRVDRSEDMRSTLKKAADLANGSYICFADRDATPLRSFVLRLADMESGQELGELLHGESYERDEKTRRVRERVLTTEDEDALKTYRCSNLSFVVRSDSFKRLLNASSADWGSLREMASALWAVCGKQRIRTVVNYVTAGAYFGHFVDRLAMRLPPGSVARRLMATSVARFVCAQTLKVYAATPRVIQEILRACWRAARGL